MKNKKIIVQISEGLGNQLFMYAHGFSLSKKLCYDLEIDNKSAYKRKKNLLRQHQKYFLKDISEKEPVIKNDFLINGEFYNIKKKILLQWQIIKHHFVFYYFDVITNIIIIITVIIYAGCIFVVILAD